MTAILYRLGRFSAARRLLVIVVWALILAAFAVGGFAFGGRLADSFSVPGTESQAALDRLDAVFPQTAGGSAQVLVVDRDGRIDAAEDKRVIADTITAIKRVRGVASVSSPFSAFSTNAVSADKHAAIISVQFTKPSSGVSDATITGLTRTASIGRGAGLAVDFSGQVFEKSDVGVSWVEGLGVLFAGVVLVITFGSLLAAGLPLLSAILGVVLSMAAIRIAALLVDVASSAPTLALMLGLAVGIDYGLFIISRHRQQLAIGMPVAESVATAVATAGTAVAFAGATVIIALLGLLVVGIPFLSIMGVGAAFAVLVAVAASVSLLPAVLALAGERLVPKPESRTARRAVAAAGGTARTMGARWVAGVLKAPVVAVLGVLVVLGVLAIPAADLELALPNNGSQPAGTSARTAYDETAKYFGEGRNGPLLLLVDITQNNDFPTALDGIRSRVAGLADVAAVGRGTPNPTLDTAILQVVPKSGPADPATVRLVNRIRALEPSFERDYRTPVQVTGSTAVQIDISARLGQALLPFGIVVVGLSVLLLLAVFRSIFVPVKAALGFLLSVLASLGVTVATFQWGWGADLLGVAPGPLLSFLPVLVMAILFGLSMDYEVFLVSGMREHWVHHRDAKGAIRHGFIAGSRVVTAAALIMVFVFASFIPDGGGTIKPIALALAAGIVFDAFLVRETFVPAAMALVGRGAWYLPKWLDRVLPVVDIEGESLTRRRTEQDWAAGRQEALLTAEALRPDGPRQEPIDLEVHAGQVTAVRATGASRRAVVATLSGRLAQASGNLQIAGLPGPSHAAELQRLAAPVFDEGGAWRSSLGDLLLERLRYASRGARRGTVAGWLERISVAATAAGMAAAGEPAEFPRNAPLGAYAADERLLVLSAAALAGGATVLVVDMGDLGRDSEQRLRAALTSLLDETCAAVLVTAPHPDLSNVLPLPNRKAVSL